MEIKGYNKGKSKTSAVYLKFGDKLRKVVHNMDEEKVQDIKEELTPKSLAHLFARTTYGGYRVKGVQMSKQFENLKNKHKKRMED